MIVALQKDGKRNFKTFKSFKKCQQNEMRLRKSPKSSLKSKGEKNIE